MTGRVIYRCPDCGSFDIEKMKEVRGIVLMVCQECGHSENAMEFIYKVNWKSQIPIKEEIIWALEAVERFNIRAHRIINGMMMHPKWSQSVLHRCPLCGYETTVTNIHRHCPENPTSNAVPMYVVEK